MWFVSPFFLFVFSLNLFGTVAVFYGVHGLESLSYMLVYFLRGTRALEFGDTPGYMGLRATLRELGARVGAKYPESVDDVGAADEWGVFDWNIGGTGNEHRGRVCKACRHRKEASWATTHK